MTQEKRAVIRWHLTKEDRDRIKNGDDIYLFYFEGNNRYSLEIGGDGTSTSETVSLLVEEVTPSGIYVRDRTK